MVCRYLMGRDLFASLTGKAYMIAPDLETAIDELQDLVERARVIAPFTGAGISTECGIPDFRSPGGSGRKTSPFRLMNSSPARQCAMKRGGGGSRWTRSSRLQNPGADTLHWQAFTAPAKRRR